jgi:hypothetical protein
LMLWPPLLVPQAASATLATASPASNFGNLIDVLLEMVNGSPASDARRRALYTTLPQRLQLIGQLF